MKTKILCEMSKEVLYCLTRMSWICLLVCKKIYLEAFNNAWNEYKNPEDRIGDASREETAHKVAWSAVKKSYEKTEKSGMWTEKT